MSPSPRPTRGLCAACVHAFLHERDCIMIFISPRHNTQHSTTCFSLCGCRLVGMQGQCQGPCLFSFSILMESGSVQLCNPLLDSQTLSTLYRADPLRSLSTLSSLRKPHHTISDSCHFALKTLCIKNWMDTYFIFHQFCK